LEEQKGDENTWPRAGTLACREAGTRGAEVREASGDRGTSGDDPPWRVRGGRRPAELLDEPAAG
jgi:hypothetical protein